jgi:hypothetical protein
MTGLGPPTGQLPMIPNAPSPPPMFGMADASKPGAKPKRASFFPTFLGTGSAPEAGQLGQKTLLGA